LAASSTNTSEPRRRPGQGPRPSSGTPQGISPRAASLDRASDKIFSRANEFCRDR
jgi:hypothetical protein